MSVPLRSAARGLLFGRPDWARRLLASIDRGEFPAADVQTDELRRVALYNDPDLDARVRKRWGNIRAGTPEEKLADIRRISNDLRAAAGRPKHGHELFKKSCATCHTLFGEGNRIGPDLTTANRKDRDFLLVSIVDPSVQIRKEFLAYVVTTNDGRVFTGLIADQTPVEHHACRPQERAHVDPPQRDRRNQGIAAVVDARTPVGSAQAARAARPVQLPSGSDEMTDDDDEPCDASASTARPSSFTALQETIMAEPLSQDRLRRMDAYWRAANYVVRRADLFARQSALERAACAPARQAAALGALGDHAGAELHLCAPEPDHQRLRPQHDLHRRPGTRRAGTRGQHVPGRNVQRVLSGHYARRSGAQAALYAVLVSRAESPATSRPKRRDRFTKGESSATA